MRTARLSIKAGNRISALGRQSQRVTQPGEPEDRPVSRAPSPDLTHSQIARQLASDPEFAEAFGRERRNPFR